MSTSLSTSPTLVPVGTSGGARLLRSQALPVTAATLVLVVLAAVLAPRTFAPASVNAILVPAGILAIAAIGQTLVVQQRGIDLSVGGMMTLSAMVIGTVHGSGLGLLPGVLLAAVVAVLGGAFNAVLVLRLHITPLLATLASNSAFVGVVWTLSGGTALASPATLVKVANGSLFGVPIIAWWAVVLIAITAVVMSRSVFGRRFTGVGASPDAARATSVATWRYVAAAYVAAALFAAVAGALLAGYAGQQTYDLGVSYQLPVIAAVVVGGASLAGGRGSVVATAVGALLLTLGVQMLLTMGAPTSARLLAQSIVLGVAAAVRMVPWRRRMQKRAGLIPAAVPVEDEAGGPETDVYIRTEREDRR